MQQSWRITSGCLTEMDAQKRYSLLNFENRHVLIDGVSV